MGKRDMGSEMATKLSSMRERLEDRFQDDWADRLAERMFVSRRKVYRIVHLIVKTPDLREDFLRYGDLLLSENV